MNNKEIRDALASAFLDAELTVRVVYARSTESWYLTASNGTMPYMVRIANHANSRRFSAVDDYWIDTTKDHLPMYINAAIKGAAMRFKIAIPEYVPKVVPVAQVAPEVVSEKCEQTSDYSTKFYQDNPQNMINLEQYYLSSQGFVCEIDNNPEKKSVVKVRERLENYDYDSETMGWVKCGIALVVILTAVFYIIR